MKRSQYLVLFNMPALLAVLLFLYGCASTPNPAGQAALPEGDFRQRISTQEAENIRVSVGVPSAKETKALFGKPLYKKGIQPVWLKIENNRDTSITFLPVGVDPDYFTPLETANFDAGDKKAGAAVIDDFFMDQSMTLIVPPGEELSGFIFTKLDEGTKAFNVDLTWEGDIGTFTFFIPVPGLNIDHYKIDWNNLYPADQYVDLDDDQVVEIIEQFSCCVTNQKGTDTGDPLNLVLIGHPIEVYVAFIRAGWDETESVDKTSMWKTVKSFMSGGEYRYSPVSNLYVFGRPQDIAFQKARDNIHERNHLRLWMSRARYQGYPVWIGQISRDIGVRFTKKTITTHKIDPNVDETREFLLEDLAYSQALYKVGYVKGVGEVPMDQPKGNLTGDPWFTDGYRLVLWVTSEPTPFSELSAMPWRNPYVKE